MTLYNFLTLSLSIIALLVSGWSWRKSRAIYQIETSTVRQVRGRSDDVAHDKSLAKINQKLISGKYTILNIGTREADGDFQIFLGKIKK